MDSYNKVRVFILSSSFSSPPQFLITRNFIAAFGLFAYVTTVVDHSIFQDMLVNDMAHLLSLLLVSFLSRLVLPCETVALVALTN
jgi:hypothetical protein